MYLASSGTRQFISSKEDSSPSVEVVTSTPNQTANSVAQRDATPRKDVVTPLSREDKPQISAEEMGQIEDFFAQLEGADVQSEAGTSQLPTDAASGQDSETSDIDSSVASESTTQSAEEVMNAYVEALRNADFEAILPYVTGTVRESIESSMRILSGESPEEFLNEALNAIEDNMPEGMPEAMLEETIEKIREEMIQSIRELQDAIQTPEGRASFSQIEIVSSEYVGDEFQFRLKAPKSDDPANTGNLLKMRKVDGDWRIYDMEGMMLFD